jgi:GNAT superfamily N-acetyltransferase
MPATGLRVLTTGDLDAVTALCARSLADAPSRAELERTLFVREPRVTVVGDPDRGVVATVAGTTAAGTADRGFVRLLVVAPDQRGHGLGRELLRIAEDDVRARGLGSITTGADAPHYLWPGVESSEVALLCLLERAKYARTETNFNMDVDLAALPPDPGGWSVATAAERAELEAWAERHWGFWTAEMVRALDRDTLVLARDADGIAAVCAYDVNRDGWIGPVAVRPDLMGRGVGVAPLLGALHRLRATGRTRAEVGWVGPIVPYARVGATVGRVFFVHRKELG